MGFGSAARLTMLVAFLMVTNGMTAAAQPAQPAPTRAVAADSAAHHAGEPDYVAQVRANFTPENRAYSSIRTNLNFLAPLYDLAAALIILFSGVSARMRDFAYARARGRYLRVLIYLTLFTIVAFLIDLPINYYRGYVVEHRFGLSNQTFGAWFGEQGKDVLVSIVLLGATGIVSLAYLAIEKSPRRWWLWLTMGTLPVSLALVLIQPLVIDPLYNKFTPLRDRELRAKIVALAERTGIPGRNVYEVDKSKQTKKYNAYVSGFGASQRIVLWDTTLKGMKEDEILFVMGHEMGHYRLAHLWKGVLLNWLLSGALFFASWLIMSRAIERFGDRWRFHQLHDVASMPLLVASISLASLIAQPATNTVSRMIEHEADVFALEVTHLNDAGARAFIKLGSQNRSNPEPSPLVKYFQYTHPPLVERIRFATGYRPWERGEPNRAYKPKN
jgi:Zn-dependent protease with chaperone function